MPTLVMIGAGNIGRGFIAPVFSSAGWKITFVDVDAVRIGAVNSRKRYTVTEADGDGRRQVAVDPVDGVDGRDRAAVAAALAACDLAATAVGLGALPHIAPGIAAGLKARGGRPLDVLVCENGLEACDRLRAAVVQALGADAALAESLGCIRTSIGRMIPADPSGDPLDITVEPYRHLPVERAAFRGPVPTVADLDPVADFDREIARKLYLHNLTHACAAYAGHLKGHRMIADCARDPALMAGVRRVGEAAAEAIARAYPGPEVLAENQALLADLLKRYANPHLNDPVARVARDPWRKLAPGDRLLGAAAMFRRTGVDAAPVFEHILLACQYHPADDEPGADRWRQLQPSGHRAILTAAGLDPKDPLMTAIDNAAIKRQRQAAAVQAMRAAAITVTDKEAGEIEIADFGLKRYAEFGLAILVYVNTKRCCAKELVMTPGQTCPEHRHPPVDGDPGKEETFRCRSGEVFLHLPGKVTDAEREAALARLPADKRQGAVTVYKTVHLRAGEQFTLPPDTLHWFTAGPQGAIVSEFSTRSRDEADIFTDAAIVRCPTE